MIKKIIPYKKLIIPSILSSFIFTLLFKALYPITVVQFLITWIIVCPIMNVANIFGYMISNYFFY